MATFLKIPRKIHHGLLLVTDLAASRDGAPLSLEEIAKKEGVSQGFLEEIAASLRAAGLIEGRRGAGGGYVLLRDPAEITVADVVAAIDGPVSIVECLADTSACVASQRCTNRAVWGKVQRRILEALRDLTVAEAAGLVVAAN